MIITTRFTKLLHKEVHIKLNKYIIDFKEIKYYSQIHDVIKKSLDFPDYYGRNWDAFWDCLSDMYGDPVHIEILGLDNVERKFPIAAEKIVKICKKFKHYIPAFENDIKIEIVSGDTRIEIK